MKLIGRLKTDPKASEAAFIPRSWGRKAVARTAEFRRVEALPRRVWSDEKAEEAARLLTDYLKTARGEMELRPIQAKALCEIHDNNGMFGPIAVGAGKSLITLLAATVVEAERPVLFVPAKLRDQTNKHVIPEMVQHWRIPANLIIMSYEELSSASKADFLTDHKPDLIIFDEVHNIKNPKAARTRRLLRYLSEHPTKVVALSGTVTKRSLRDYWHILRYALPAMCPLPLIWSDLQDWAYALDAKVEDEKRVGPGALCIFSEGKTDIEDVRDGFRKRLTETPGVVATSKSAVDTGLDIFARSLKIPKEISEAFLGLRETWELPCGDEITDAASIWRLTNQLANGFYYKWDPAPPMDWMEARRAWKGFVRTTLRYNKRNLDSEFQVAKACVDGVYNSYEYKDWVDIRDTFKPNPVPYWISDFAVEDAQEWALKNEGIVWVEHRAVGDRFDKIPYFGAGNSDILTHNGPCVASVSAHSEGKNLQRWSKNLVMAPRASGALWEQMIGRTHRPGQYADEVTFQVNMLCREQWAAFEQALKDAAYIERTTGQKQKLSLATIDKPDDAEVSRKTGPLWFDKD